MKKGDTVGLIAPSSGVSADRAERAVKELEALGINVIAGVSCYGKHGYLSGSDAMRAGDINEMFSRKDIDGILCMRGGYGAQRLLERIDFDMIKENPKFFGGYSDITALHTVINQRCGFVTYHMVMADKIASGLDGYTSGYYERCLFGKLEGELANPEGQPLNRLTGGKCDGKLTGGNLSLLATSIGTDYEIDTRDKIVFIEEVGEEPYKIDRMLTQLRLAGKFSDCRGIVFGAFTDCEPKEESLTYEQIFEEIIVPAGKPCVYGLACGHCLPTMALPLGATVSLDADNLKLIILRT